MFPFFSFEKIRHFFLIKFIEEEEEEEEEFKDVRGSNNERQWRNCIVTYRSFLHMIL